MALRILFALLPAALVSWAGVRVRALTRDGAVAASAVGAAVLAGGGVRWAGIMMVFFVSGTALSLLPRPRGLEAGQGPTRDSLQVLANGGAAGLYGLLSLMHPSELWAGGFAAAVATATADTWATEIGSRFGGTPIRISDGARLDRGVSGGVTVLGTRGAVVGSALIGVTAIAFRALTPPAAAICSVCGFVGAALDSLLGAMVQEQRFCPSCLASTEQQRHGSCGTPTVRVGGVPGITNDAVNAISTSVATLLCVGALAVLWL